MVVSALIGAGPTVGRVGEFGAFSRLFGGNLVSVSIDLEFVVPGQVIQTIEQHIHVWTKLFKI